MSCLFNSLSTFVSEPPQQIRGKICDWLATDPLLIDDMRASLVVSIESGKDLGQYVKHMRNSSTWGGAVEIRAFVTLWKRPVHVWVIQTHRWIEFPCDKGVACKLRWTGGHYDPMT